MNILQIVTHSYPCGVVSHALLVADQLQQRGHRVTVLCPAQGALPTQLQSRGVPTQPIAENLPDKLRQLQSLSRQARAQPVDVIHAHTTRAAYYGVLLGQRAQTPVVATLHSLTHDLVYRRLLPRRANRMIAVSEAQQKRLVEQNIPASYLRAVYNGTDMLDQAARLNRGEAASAVRAELNLPLPTPIIGLIGDVGEAKGHPLLLSAIPEILAHCPSAHFVFVGHRHADAFACLLETATRLGITDRLHFLGARSDIARLLASMDILAVPSRWETFGLVVIEAMAMGTPVVAARVGGLPEIVVDGETGVLVERGPAAFAQALVALLQNPSRRARMGMAGQARVQELFTADAMLDRIEDVYEEAVQARHGWRARRVVPAWQE